MGILVFKIWIGTAYEDIDSYDDIAITLESITYEPGHLAYKYQLETPFSVYEALIAGLFYTTQSSGNTTYTLKIYNGYETKRS